jgi:hypothetical protein
VAAIVAVAAVGAAVLVAGTHRRDPAPVAACPAAAGPLRADLDGDGCDESLTFDQGVLSGGGRRYAVGQPGDRVAVGRWLCAGPTVALLRMATGEVFRFDAWPDGEHPAPASLVGRVPGAAALEAKHHALSACDDLVVRRTAGPPVVVGREPVTG